jgi:hypothetical protein
MGAGVGEAEIGLGFHDASGEEGVATGAAIGLPTFAGRWRRRDASSRCGGGRQAADEELAEEFAGDDAGIALVEGARQRREAGKGAGGERGRGHGARILKAVS